MDEGDSAGAAEGGGDRLRGVEIEAGAADGAGGQAGGGRARGEGMAELAARPGDQDRARWHVRA